MSLEETGDDMRPAWWFRQKVVIMPPTTDWKERFPVRGFRQVARIPSPSVPAKATKGAPVEHTYLIGAEGSPLVKIGYATNPKKRLASLQTGQPMQLTLLWSHPVDHEAALHERFAEYRVRGEWFDLTPLGDPVAAVQSAVEALEMQKAQEAMS